MPITSAEFYTRVVKELKRFPMEEFLLKTPVEAMEYYKFGGLYTVPREIYEQQQVKIKMLEELLEKYESQGDKNEI